MKLKPTRIKVTAKDKDSSIRMELAALDKMGGRKVFSFNLYETDLEEVMRVLVLTFETLTAQKFSPDIKKEIGMDPGAIFIQRRRQKGKKKEMLEQVKHMVKNGERVAIPGVEKPDGWKTILSRFGDIVAEPMTKMNMESGELEVTGYVFYRKKD